MGDDSLLRLLGGGGGGGGKSKPSPFLSRSFTVFPTNPLDPPQKPSIQHRSQSIKKHLCSSLESMMPDPNSLKGKVKRLCSLFESQKSPSASPNDDSSSSSKLLQPSSSPTLKSKLAKSNASYSIWTDSSIRLPGTEDRIVVYFTSLRGIRRTFEDCYAVRMIFKGLRVWVDERDISMDSAYRKELQGVLVQKRFGLPQVFVRGRLLGGAEMVKQLNEIGELAKLIDGFPVREPWHLCQSCGDARFVPCRNCDGSRKVFEDDEEAPRRCLVCNENGLIRCPNCCS